MDVLSPFISVLCHFDWLFHGESCPRIDFVYPGRAWSSSPACTWRFLHYLFLQATPLFTWCDHSTLASLIWQCLTSYIIAANCASGATSTLVLFSVLRWNLEHSIAWTLALYIDIDRMHIFGPYLSRLPIGSLHCFPSIEPLGQWIILVYLTLNITTDRPLLLFLAAQLTPVFLYMQDVLLVMQLPIVSHHSKELKAMQWLQTGRIAINWPYSFLIHLINAILTPGDTSRCMPLRRLSVASSRFSCIYSRLFSITFNWHFYVAHSNTTMLQNLPVMSEKCPS